MAPVLSKGERMNFGSLQMVTAWRLTRAGVHCDAIVMDGPAGVRLVVIEDQQIVQWERFSRIHELRAFVTRAFRDRRNTGWVPSAATSGGREVVATRPVPSPGLFPPDA